MNTSPMAAWRSEARTLRDEFLDDFIGLMAAVAVVIVLLLEWAT